ncbi:MAG: LysM peptidoglycan-binding domain-containing protein [Candidatus Sericytochromatia bacterium]|nr:LysM peptidoglycan-binding domain-containing protein [Candidatus Tanganyikabacteria bacterium]
MADTQAGLTVLLLGSLPDFAAQASPPAESVQPRIQTAPLTLSQQPLKRGEAGPRVAKLQDELRELGFFPPATTPPYFGMSTHAAVCNFQKAWGLIPDGTVGPTTQAAIDEALRRNRNNPSRRPVTYTVRPGDSLLRIAHALLGDANRWREILDFNHLRDPNRIVPGMVLKIPPQLNR